MDNLDDLPAVTELLGLLGDANPLVRRNAASQLCVMLPPSEKVIRALGLAINDDDNEVARHAGIALISYGPDSRLVIAEVMEALEHSDICVRRVAAGILFMIGPEGKAAVPVLESLRNDEDNLLRGWVGQALKSITGTASS